MIAYLRSVEHGLRPSSLQDQEFKREFFFLERGASSSLLSSRVGCQEAQCVGHSNAHVDAVEELPRALRRLGVRGRLLGPQGLRRCAPRTRPSPPRAPGSIPHLHSNAREPIRDITWHPTLTLSRSRPSFDRSGAHFLTHAHSDHLVGLKNGWRSPTGAKIYCTAITKALILRKYPKLPGTSIVTLAPDQPTVVDLGGTGELLTVTAIDAGHCPGSVGFLFEGACGRIYHTGDFRREDWAEDPSTIPTQLCKAPLDLLLLDNTYCNPAYAFPTRAHAQSTIIDLIVHQYPEREIVVGIDSLGQGTAVGRHCIRDGAPGAGHQGTIRRR
jgi:hypothetical protein